MVLANCGASSPEGAPEHAELPIAASQEDTVQRQPAGLTLTLSSAQELQAADLHESDAESAVLKERLTALGPCCAASQEKRGKGFDSDTAATCRPARAGHQASST